MREQSNDSLRKKRKRRLYSDCVELDSETQNVFLNALIQTIEDLWLSCDNHKMLRMTGHPRNHSPSTSSNFIPPSIDGAPPGQPRPPQPSSRTHPQAPLSSEPNCRVTPAATLVARRLGICPQVLARPAGSGQPTRALLSAATALRQIAFIKKSGDNQAMHLKNSNYKLGKT